MAVQFSEELARANDLTRKAWDEAVDFTNGDMACLLDSIGKFVRGKVAEATAPLLQRIDKLESERWEFCGEWTDGQYKRNSVVMHAGSAWIATRDTTQQPVTEAAGGDGSWRILVKRGRDAPRRMPTSHSHVRQPY